MTEMMSGVDNADDSKPATALNGLDEQLVAQLVSRARASGLQLTGEGGMLAQLTKLVLESALEGEITDHLGYDKHAPAGRGTGNSRNGTRSKTVLTDVGPVEINVPRDRDASFEPKIVAKRRKRLGGVDEMVISLAAKGLTTGEISAHLAEVYGAEVSRCRGVEADHLHHHRQGGGGHGRVAESAVGPGLSGGLHRRDPRQDP